MSNHCCFLLTCLHKYSSTVICFLKGNLKTHMQRHTGQLPARRNPKRPLLNGKNSSSQLTGCPSTSHSIAFPTNEELFQLNREREIKPSLSSAHSLPTSGLAHHHHHQLAHTNQNSDSVGITGSSSEHNGIPGLSVASDFFHDVYSTVGRPIYCPDYA